MAEEFVQHEHIIITSTETVRMMSDPMRMRIAEALEDPHSVKQLAAIFDVPVTRLYYHINLMEEHGVIGVAETQIVSGLVEKQYQSIAREFSIDSGIFHNDPKAGRRVDEIVGALFDNARRQLRLLITKREEQKEAGADPREDTIKINYNVLALTSDELKTFEVELDALLERYDRDVINPSPEAELYSFTSVLYPNVEAEEIAQEG